MTWAEGSHPKTEPPRHTNPLLFLKESGNRAMLGQWVEKEAAAPGFLIFLPSINTFTSTNIPWLYFLPQHMTHVWTGSSYKQREQKYCCSSVLLTDSEFHATEALLGLFSNLSAHWNNLGNSKKTLIPGPYSQRPCFNYSLSNMETRLRSAGKRWCAAPESPGHKSLSHQHILS